MDDGISLFLSNFEKRNELENTLVIFASDNGPPFLGGRTNLYQFGIRTPLIISHPHFRNEKSKNYHPKRQRS
jgi:N-sulfoglucosamine sulfohydrolase